MSQDCSHDCSSCSASCSERREIPWEQPHEMSHIKKVIGVVSGKGGVGKSLVTGLLAVAMQRKGYHTGILDADITGPSIPKAFGITKKAEAKAEGLYPLKSESGIDIMSINLLMERETDPVVWRGPVIAGAVKQFWTDVIWENEDYLFIDMPPGTGDVPLTIYQSIPIDGIVIVTSPQALVSMVVTKAVKMAEMMNIPVLGIVENMAYYKCPDCGGEHQIYGKSHVAELAESYSLEVLARIPIDPRIAEACDEGLIESLGGEWMDALAQGLLEGVKRQEESSFIRIAVPVTEGDVIAADFLKASCFKFYNVENGKLDSSVCVDPAGSGQEAIVKFLKMYGVNVAICGSVEDETVAKLQEADVWVVSGLEGKADEQVDAFLAGQIEGTFGSGCGGNCGHHHDEDEAQDR